MSKNLLTDKNYEILIVEDIELNIETALPCGLVLNELITNAFKYAFKEHKNPKLSIEI